MQIVSNPAIAGAGISEMIARAGTHEGIGESNRNIIGAGMRDCSDGQFQDGLDELNIHQTNVNQKFTETVHLVGNALTRRGENIAGVDLHFRSALAP